MTLTTTLDLILAHDPCNAALARWLHEPVKDHYTPTERQRMIDAVRVEVGDRPLPLLEILDRCGMSDLHRAAQFVPPEQEAERDRVFRLLACDYAEESLPTWDAFAPTDHRVRDCIATMRRYAVGEATEEERSAAWSAAESAAGSAAWSAESAARSARSAAWSAESAATHDRHLAMLRRALGADEQSSPAESPARMDGDGEEER